jgi:hypothetical protein
VNRRLIIAALLGALCVGGALWCQNEPDPDKEAIERRVSGFEWSVENANKEAFLVGLAHDYADRFGYDRRMLTDRVFLVVSKMRNLDVEIFDFTYDSLDKKMGQARVHFKVRLHGEGRPRGFDEAEIRSRNLVLQLRQYGNEWLVKRADLGIDLFSTFR